MNGRFLLDTNVVIALFASEAGVQQRIASVEVYVPSIALAELYYGAQRSARADVNIARLDSFASSAAVLGCDLETARLYGTVKAAVHARGRPLPENDIWIAAIAYQHGLTIATRDQHFREVEGIAVEIW